MKHMKKRLLSRKLFVSFILFTFISLSGYAQSIITGKVLDDTNLALPGVSILVKGTSKGTTTDFDGEYSLEASPDDVLIFSFLGFKTQEILVGSQTTIDVQLVSDSQALDEVVVVGYGSVKKSDVVGSVSQVTAKSFEDQPLTRAEDALQGRAAGVAVSKSSGQPGAAIKVRIRGVNSINGNNNPLVVVDGVIGGDLSTINPSDIASMDVLKDASATAIYGSRGSNGVILITTKKGRGKSKINAEYFMSFDNVPEYLPTLGAADFAKIENSRLIRVGGNPIFTDQEIAGFEQNGGTNYQKAFFRQGMTQNAQLSASGSEGKISYFLSGNYVNQEGLVIETGYERFSIRSNVDAEINDKLKVGLNVFAVRATTINNIDGFRSFQGSEVVKALGWDPTTPIFNAEGGYNTFSSKGIASLNYNPIANMNGSKLEFIEDRLNINVNLNYEIIDGLSYGLVVGASAVNNTSENYVIDFTAPDASYNGSKTTGYQVSNILTWAKTFGKHNITATGVYEFSDFENRSNGYSAQDLAVPNGFYLGELAGGQSIFNGYNKSAIQSVMGRASYVYDESLYVTGTIRMDQSSRFRSDKNTGYFPSVALKYSLKKMDFINNGNVLTDFAVRAGWGQVGNQDIAPYSTYPSVNANSSYPFDGSTRSAGSSPAGYGNPDLTWETTTQLNFGVDLAFWNGRANFSMDLYQKNTEDLLLDVPVPTTNGGGFITRNIGEVENRGIDLTLGGGIIQGDNFNWESNFSFSYVKNEVVDLGGVESIQGTFGSTDGKSQTWNIIQVGEPIGQFQGATFLGTWKTAEATEAAIYGRIPGDAKYQRDTDGNVIFSAIGNGTPTTFWGFNNTLTYKNWDMNIFFQGVHGFDVYNTVQGMIVGATGNQRSFLSVEQLNQWTPTNETDIPAGGDNINGSTRYVEDGSFIRLQNLTIGYTLRDLGFINSLKIYAGGQNLFMITDYTGYDPEHTSRPADNAGNVDVAAGINAGAYPNPRTFTVGFKLGF
ncbi:TonB-dependent receptor [Aureibaculum algae]|uniref:TonB-dependent receptor n=1 Tax=Aureibaculum algae TaxID=2584122 RepID=A0A5B7TYF5_9FLAO|nr:TonB-dependent receptor [Aureibaculum algae]QCX40331.1 TonB-dependent receptor [Aureibaculum algae]